ncbi:M20 family metallo-hydrolase [Halovulum sp. GXIMD14794]
MINSSAPADGDTAATRLERIAKASAVGPGVTRLPYTPEHSAALDQIRAWMQDAGLEPRLDAAGTLIGRTTGDPARPALLLGSHQDSVRQGGAFDGIMGVALACLTAKRLQGADLPFALEVLAFADEEGVRFPTALIAPRALAGTLPADALAMTDAEGVPMVEAMRRFGLTPEDIPALRRDPASVVGYLEAHIEQGPVLERENLPLGVVIAICGIARYAVTFTGETGHAGTLPMQGRRDALVAASEFIAEVHDRAAALPELRATVGQISIAPNVVNAVPSRAELTLEVRAPEDATREAFEADAQALAKILEERRGVGVTVTRTYAQPATACDARLRACLSDAIQATGQRPLALPSGATHDASAMADLCPVGMLFVRCRDGVSHRPEEYAAPGDMDAAVTALVGAIERLACA